MKFNPLSKLFCGALCAAMVLLFSWQRPVSAATVTVNTLVDENDYSCSDGDCSLRDAIEVAAADDTITFSVTGTLSLTLGELGIDKNLTLNGPGASSLTLSGANASRILHVQPSVTVSISGLALANGLTVDVGGAIYNEGNLTVTSSTITGNHATDGGAIYGEYASSTSITDSVLSNNVSDNDGGAISVILGTLLSVTNTTFTGNNAANNGGSISSMTDTAAIANSTFSNNTAGNDGGGIYHMLNPMTLTNSTLSGNTAGNDGGGMVNASGTMTLTNTALTGNRAENSGGGMRNDGALTANGCNFSGNTTAGDGGGIANSFGGVLTVTDCTFSTNSADADGGGIANLFSEIHVSGSTFSSNTAGANGGGISNLFASTADLTNSTLANNRATGDGGGIGSWGTLDVANSTFSGNRAASGGALLALNNTATFTNTIVANSAAGGNCVGTIVDGGHNLRWPKSDPSCVGKFGNPKLSPLANNGGATLTMALGATSKALGAGDNGVCAAAPVNGVDQRGFPRPNPPGTVCDIGAYESALPPPPTLLWPKNGARVSTQRPKLDWSASPGATSYKIELRKTSTSGTKTQATTTLSEYKTKKLAKGTRYYWRVAACNAAGCSAWTKYRWFQVA